MPSIAVHWIKDNVVAAIIFRLASLAIYGVSQAADVDAGSGAAVVLYLADICFLGPRRYRLRCSH
jgi:hypothetical protein